MSSKQTQADGVVEHLDALSSESSPSSSDQTLEHLTRLKEASRNPKNNSALFSRSGLQTLSRYAFDDKVPAAVSNEACKSIANIMFLTPALRQTFVSLGLVSKATSGLRSLSQDGADHATRKYHEDEAEFLLSRLLFFSTYKTRLDLVGIVRSNQLNEAIDSLINYRVQVLESGGKFPPIDNMAGMALRETLQLAFSITSEAPELGPDFLHSQGPLFRLLRDCPSSNPPLEPPFTSIVNLLANLDLTRDRISSESLPKSVDCLVSNLDEAVKVYKPFQLDISAIPVLTVLRKVYAIGSVETQKHMQDLLLPNTASRDQPIGKGDDLPARLLRMTTSSGMMNLSESISGLMWELSDKDANRYVLNVGFGYAAGYLATHGINLPDAAKSNGTDRVNGQQIAINPITGQRLDQEPDDTGPVMTQAEKEREAERLYVLFERLKATGVIDVENPVHKAMAESSGQRIEEISDSD